jgi:hypothetical protein
MRPAIEGLLGRSAGMVGEDALIVADLTDNRSLEGKQYVYPWVDGVHFNVRLEKDRSASWC